MKKTVFFIVFSILTFSVYGQQFLGSSKNRINDFWKFISENEENIFKLNNPNSTLHSEIFKKIQLINKNIYVMISNEIVNNKKNLIITSNGNASFFDLCDTIVNLAPNYKYIRPISLFPALDKIEPFIIGDIVIKIEDVRVHFDENNKNINLLFLLNNEHLTILQNDKSGQLYNIYMHILFMMTQQVLGERIVGEKIKSGDISLVNIIIPSIPMSELGKHIK